MLFNIDPSVREAVLRGCEKVRSWGQYLAHDLRTVFKVVSSTLAIALAFYLLGHWMRSRGKFLNSVFINVAVSIVEISIAIL